MDGEVTDAEDGGEDGAAESATTGNSLVGVESVGEGLASEKVTNGLLEGGNTRGTTNKLNDIDVLSLELGIGKSLLDVMKGIVTIALNTLKEVIQAAIELGRTVAELTFAVLEFTYKTAARFIEAAIEAGVAVVEATYGPGGSAT